MTLTDLITVNSWFLFYALQIDYGFLHKSSHTWQYIGLYQQAQEKVNAINIINDCAERGVKLTTDYLSCAQSESQFQNVLQVVEQNEKNYQIFTEAAKQQ